MNQKSGELIKDFWMDLLTGQPRSMFSWIETHPELGKVDVCINNAGLSTAETLSEGTMESWRQMMDVNVLGRRVCNV